MTNVKAARRGKLHWLWALVTLAVLCLPLAAQAEEAPRIWKLEANVEQVVACGDVFAVLVEGKVWLCDPQDGAQQLLRKDSRDVYLHYLFGREDGSLWALSTTEASYNIYSISLEDGTAALAWQIERYGGPAGYLRKALWHNGQIVLEFENEGIRQSDLLLFDTASEKAVSIYGLDMMNLHSFGDKQLLGLQRRYGEGYGCAVVAMDAQTQAIHTVCTVAAFPEGLGTGTNQILTFAAPMISVFSQEGELQRQLYLPVAYGDYYFDRSLAATAFGYAGLSDGTRLMAAPMDQSQTGPRLQIARFNADGAETKAFRLAHPEVQVYSLNLGYQLTPAMVGQMIQGQDTETDIFMVRSFETGYLALLKKGFCADLSGHGAIAEKIEAMPPALSAALMREGQVLGVPVHMEFDTWTALACDPNTLADAGLTLEDLPTNLCDLLDKLIGWYGDGPLSGIRLFSFSAENQAYVLAWYTLQNYSHYASTQSEWLDYDTELFRSLMEKCDRLGAMLKADAGITDTSPALLGYTQLEGQYMEGIMDTQLFLPLVPQAGMEQRYPAYMTVATVNPLSKNTELAYTYLAEALETLPAQTKLLFWPQQATPAQQPEYVKSYQRAQNEVIRLAGLLENSGLGGAERASLEGLLKEAEQWLQGLERDPWWAVSPATIQRYQQLAPQVFIPGSNVREMLDENMIAQVQQYAAGQMDMDALVEAIIRKAKMIQAEDE